MTPEERVLALAMYREELSEVTSGEWPPGVTTNLGELDWQAEKLIREEWRKLKRSKRTDLLREIGAEILLSIQKDNEAKSLRG